MSEIYVMSPVTAARIEAAVKMEYKGYEISLAISRHNQTAVFPNAESGEALFKVDGANIDMINQAIAFIDATATDDDLRFDVEGDEYDDDFAISIPEDQVKEASEAGERSVENRLKKLGR